MLGIIIVVGDKFDRRGLIERWEPRVVGNCVIVGFVT